MTKQYIVQANQTQRIHLTKSGDYQVKLVGKGAHAEILAAFSLAQSQSLTLDLTIIHEVAQTSAETLLKVVVDEKASAIVSGTIIVAKNAQQTNSFLTEKMLMLSDSSKALAIPNLEIEANDVRCSHAATVGQIPPEYLFYLQSRGLSIKSAKNLVAQGFLNEVMNRLD